LSALAKFLSRKLNFNFGDKCFLKTSFLDRSRWNAMDVDDGDEKLIKLSEGVTPSPDAL
jgi:hypothetical protein